MYLLFADAVIIVHCLFIAFVVGGGLLALRWCWLAFLHLPAVCWGAFIEFSGGICPLTPLENHFRMLGGQSVYGGDFIAQYLIPVIYPSGLTAHTQLILGGLVVVINLAIYGFVLYRLFHRKKDFLPRR